MIVLNGGSYYPESKEIDKMWIDKINMNDLIIFVPAATTRSQESYFDFFKKQMGGYGFSNIEYVDLYTNWERAYEAKAIYIAGGNTYKLIDIMRKSGFADFIKQHNKSLIVIGNSAGAVVLGKDIRTSNDSDIIGIDNMCGLGLVDYSICPHYTEEKDNRLISLSNELNQIVLGISEKSALIIEENEIIINDVKTFKPKNK